VNVSLASGSIEENNEDPVLLLCFNFTTAILILSNRISQHKVVLVRVLNVMSMYVRHYDK